MSDKKTETRAFGVNTQRGELCTSQPKLAASKSNGQITAISDKQEKPPARDDK